MTEKLCKERAKEFYSTTKKKAKEGKFATNSSLVALMAPLVEQPCVKTLQIDVSEQATSGLHFAADLHSPAACLAQFKLVVLFSFMFLEKKGN